MVVRKLSLAVATAVLCICAFGANVHPELPEVKKVYLLPMTSGLDQYLAERLTRAGRFEVVTDPKIADAVFTDRLGPAFEERWEQLYPPPPPPEEPKQEQEKDKKKSSGPSGFMEDVVAAPVTRVSSFSRGRGNVFLVSRKSKAVVWSNFAPPRDTRSRTMSDTADNIVDKLQKDLQVKK